MKLDRRNWPLFLVLTGLLLPLGGCGILDEGEPETAKIIIEGGGGEGFYLLTSNDFDIVVNQETGAQDVFLISADTLLVTPPYTKSYSLGSRTRFYLKAYREEALPQTVNIRLLIDGEQRYNSTTDLDGVEPEFVFATR